VNDKSSSSLEEIVSLKYTTQKNKAELSGKGKSEKGKVRSEDANFKRRERICRGKHRESVKTRSRR